MKSHLSRNYWAEELGQVIHVADLDQFVQGDVVAATGPAAGCR
jgi:hypothetical protein